MAKSHRSARSSPSGSWHGQPDPSWLQPPWPGALVKHTTGHSPRGRAAPRSPASPWYPHLSPLISVSPKWLLPEGHIIPPIFLVPKKANFLNHEDRDAELKNITKLLFIRELEGNDSHG